VNREMRYFLEDLGVAVVLVASSFGLVIGMWIW
jgi:hypothetical protein